MDFSLSFSVVLPLCIYIALGVIAKKASLIDTTSAGRMDKVIFRLLFPMAMFDNVQNAGDALRGTHNFNIIAYLFCIVSIEFILLLIFVPIFIKNKPRQSSFIQGAFRANSVLFAIPIVASICGSSRLGIVSMCVAAIVPYYNVVCVILLEVNRGGKIKLKDILIRVFTNPLILGAIVGLFFVFTGLNLPTVLSKTISTLGTMVTPLALIMLGVGLKFEGVKRDITELFFVCLIKLILIPVLTSGIGYLIGFRGDEFISLFALSCVPTAVASYPMAEQMGADGPFAGEIVAVTTVTSLLTVFIWVSILSGHGLL